MRRQGQNALTQVNFAPIGQRFAISGEPDLCCGKPLQRDFVALVSSWASV